MAWTLYEHAKTCIYSDIAWVLGVFLEVHTWALGSIILLVLLISTLVPLVGLLSEPYAHNSGCCPLLWIHMHQWKPTQRPCTTVVHYSKRCETDQNWPDQLTRNDQNRPQRVNKTSKKVLRSRWKWYQSPGRHQEWGKSAFRLFFWFFEKKPCIWAGLPRRSHFAPGPWFPLRKKTGSETPGPPNSNFWLEHRTQPLAGKGNGTFQPPPKKANPRPKTAATPHANFNPVNPIQISSRWGWARRKMAPLFRNSRARGVYAINVVFATALPKVARSRCWREMSYFVREPYGNEVRSYRHPPHVKVPGEMGPLGQPGPDTWFSKKSKK